MEVNSKQKVYSLEEYMHYPFPYVSYIHTCEREQTWAEVDEGEVDLGSGVTEREWEGDGEVNEEVDWIQRQ